MFDFSRREDSMNRLTKMKQFLSDVEFQYPLLRKPLELQKYMLRFLNTYVTMIKPKDLF